MIAAFIAPVTPVARLGACDLLCVCAWFGVSVKTTSCLQFLKLAIGVGVFLNWNFQNWGGVWTAKRKKKEEKTKHLSRTAERPVHQKCFPKPQLKGLICHVSVMPIMWTKWTSSRAELWKDSSAGFRESGPPEDMAASYRTPRIPWGNTSGAR